MALILESSVEMVNKNDCIFCFPYFKWQRLHHAVNNESFLDFGTLGIGNKRSMFFVVINENPIEVGVHIFEVSVGQVSLKLSTMTCSV